MRRGVLHVRGLKDSASCTVIDVTIEFDCRRVVVTDNLADTVNYVPVLELLILGLRSGVDVRVLEALTASVDSRIISLYIRDQASSPSAPAGPIPQALFALGLHPLTVNTMFGFCDIERTRPQPMNLHIFTDADFRQVPELRDVVVQDVFCTANKAATRTIECMAAAVATTLIKHVKHCTVILEKPEIGILCGHNMQNASFEFSLSSDAPLSHALKPDEIPPRQSSLPPRGAASMEDMAAQFQALQAISSAEYTIIGDFLLDHALTTFSTADSISVLDIGAGFGFIPSLPCLGGRVSDYIAFEPNPCMVTALQQAVFDQLRPATHTIVSDLFTFGGAQKLPQRGKQNLAVLCHSMYGFGMDGTKELLSEVRECLDPATGVCVVAHRASSVFRSLKDVISMFHVVHAQVTDSPIHFETASEADIVKCLGCYHGVYPTCREEELQMLSYLHSVGGILDTKLLLMILKPRLKEALEAPFSVELEDLSTKISVLLPQSAEFQNFVSRIKNKDARSACPIAVVVPATIAEVQSVAQWSAKYGIEMSVVGGGHSDHCCSPASLCVTLQRFQSVEVDTVGMTVRIGGGATIKNITDACDANGVFTPLGSRPSVGIGHIIHGGVGHFTASHGLSCDSIMSATVVTPMGEVVFAGVGQEDVLFAVRGCGSAVGIIVELVMRCYPFEAIYTNHEKILNLQSTSDRREQICKYFVSGTQGSPSRDVRDAYFTSSNHDVGDIWIQTFTRNPAPPAQHKISKYSDIFDAELHCNFPAASRDFKRSVMVAATDALPDAIAQILDSAPTNLSYLHALECGANDKSSAAGSCFNRRQWNWLIVITGRWSSGSDDAAVRQWVFASMDRLIAAGGGSAVAYPADLGVHQFQDAQFSSASAYDASSILKLSELKNHLDPQVLLPNGFPLIRMPKYAPSAVLTGRLKAVVALCGKRFVGKDFVAEKIAQQLRQEPSHFTVAVDSISSVFKKRYAAEVGCDLHKLLNDRDYKESHRCAMTKYYEKMKGETTDEETLAELVRGHGHADLLVITGMREAQATQHLRRLPCASMSVLVTASSRSRAARGWFMSTLDLDRNERLQDFVRDWDSTLDNSDNESDAHITHFARSIVEPWLRRATLPSPPLLPGSPAYQVKCGIEDIHRGGIVLKDYYALTMHPHLLQHVARWMGATIRSVFGASLVTIVTVETGGVMFARPVADEFQAPMIIIRKGNGAKEPHPRRSATYQGSNITGASTTLQIRTSSVASAGRIVVFIDDTLSSGRTLDAVVGLLAPQCSISLALFLMEFPVCLGSGGVPIPRPDTRAMIQFPGK